MNQNIEFVEGRWYVMYWEPTVRLFITLAKFVGQDSFSNQFEDVFGKISRYPKEMVSSYKFIEIDHIDYMLEYLSLFWI